MLNIEAIFTYGLSRQRPGITAMGKVEQYSKNAEDFLSLPRGEDHFVVGSTDGSDRALEKPSNRRVTQIPR